MCSGYPAPHGGFSGGDLEAQQTGGRYRTGIYFDDQLHPGQSVDAYRTDDGVGPGEWADRKDFGAAISRRSRPVADIEQGYISTTSCILANLSMRTGRTMAWDPENGQIGRISGRRSRGAADRWPISNRDIFRRPAASWPICRCVPDGRWRGTRRMG